MTSPATPPRFSVIMPNYNYEKFVGAAIESVLAADWPDVEIIVVDDGSTDGSRAVIERYLPRGVKAMFKKNEGQAAACNDGYMQSSGKFLLFLDSDDLIAPDLFRKVFESWRPGVSKVQVQMITVNADGESIGSVFPHYPADITPEAIRKAYFASSAYATPPGSGNVYCRAFCDKIFPLEAGMDFSDSYLLSTAPILGEVVTIREPLVSYRIHGSNSGAMDRIKPEKFSIELRRAIDRNDYASGIAARYGIAYDKTNVMKSFKNLQLRAAHLVFGSSDHPVLNDSRLSILKDTPRALAAPQGNSTKAQWTSFFFLWLILASPRFLSRRMLSWRYAPATRPRWLRALVSRL
ncbi:glycosyltransferase family 2 protein [Bradyrhizobium yuanmingense]|uniref:glycosyltransferase family 2 protein n=1 Tax=Bradyrhizobium yuanmingense TaxID=108015 RepID=UPI0023B9EDB9|nr:glycosyltransferase family 2 protein [Bradyrhizobium yuanmingense]MDF0578885.1 glycosyltransferase family 2 protein [Bradyrhizobium yuanmingense]